MRHTSRSSYLQAINKPLSIKWKYILLLYYFSYYFSSVIIIPTSYALTIGNSDERNKPYNLQAPNCPGRSEPKSTPISWRHFAAKNGIIDNNTSNHVVIPCDTVVLIQGGTHIIFNGGLAIRGKLIFEDGGDDIVIESTFILVLGWIRIGSASRYFQSKITFILKDQAKKEALIINEGQPTAYDFGRKAFVVLGGRVSFHGVDKNAPTYVSLIQSSMSGSNKIVVEGDVQSYWKLGDTLGIASSSIRGDLASRVVITDLRVMMRGSIVTEITLQEPLKQSHVVRSVVRSDPERSDIIFLRPEVIRLNRNIIIRGSYPKTDLLDDNRKRAFLGGHFIMSHTAYPQIIDGVEFIHMGQSGISGRYPIHYHFGGYVTSKSRIARNSIHDSFQRCIVVHATHNLNVTDNVAFNTHGHCFVTEDGIETGNKFIGNVAMDVKPALRKIKVSFGDTPTDSDASGFWFAGPHNDVINNVVAGAYNTGYWYEGSSFVGGESGMLKLPGADTLNVKKESFGLFLNNVAHSLNIGLNPGYGKEPVENVFFDDYFSWSVNRGFHSGAGVRMGLRRATIVDFFSCGIAAMHSNGFTVQDSILIGELYMPKHCDQRDVAGLQLSPSTLPVGQPANPFVLKNIHFQNLASSTNCQLSNTAIEIIASKDDKWGVNSYVEGITFDDHGVDTHWLMHNYDKVYDIGVVIFKIHKNGMGGLGPHGSVVSIGWENWEMITAGCHNMESLREGLNAVYCPHSCWRHVNLEFEEIGLVGTYVEIYSLSTGNKWIQHSKQRNPAEVKERVIELFLPMGNYEVKMIWVDGEVMLIENMPKPRTVEMDQTLDFSLCPGSVGITITNPSINKKQ